MTLKRNLNIFSNWNYIQGLLNGKGIVSELFRFGIVGGIATSIHYGIYLLALEFLSINISYALGYIISFIVNYSLSVFFTFKSKTSIKTGVGFVLSHLINYCMHFGLLNLFVYLDCPVKWAPAPVLLIAIPINFILVRFVFTSRVFK